MTSPSASTDRIVPWPIILTCCFPIILVILWSGPFDLAFLGVPALIAIWIGAACLASGIAVVSARAQNWRRTVSMLVLPLFTLFAAANLGTAWGLAIDAGESLHFQIMRSSYVEDVSKIAFSGEPRFAMWRWGGFGVGHGVVYDESDEIMLSEQSLGWKKRVANTEVGMCGAWGSPLGDHFYLVRTGC